MNATVAGGRIGPVRRSIDAWIDSWSVSGRGDWRAPAVLLTLFVALWTTFQIVAYASIDLHPDVTEVYAWSRHPSPGYYKHPPLNALMAFVWLRVFPAADWSFHLLAMTNAAIALFATDLISRRYLSGDKRLMVLLLLLLTPFYQFHADLFSTNQVLLSTWPIATYAFLRAFDSKTVLWSIAAGAAAAAAMLGKYYSIYLVASFPIAVLLHPQGRAYLKSASPWISIAAGLAVLSPHLYWLFTTGFQPFHYAYAVHGAPLGKILLGDLSYLVGGLGYVVLPVGAYLLAARPSRAAIGQALWPSDPRTRLLVSLLAGPLILPPLLAPLVGVVLNPLWTMQSWFLLPIVLLAPAQVVLPRVSVHRVGAVVLGMAIVVVAAAPAIAWLQHVQGARDGRDYHRLAAEETTRLWREATGRPLTIVLGEPNAANAAALYSPDHPDAAPGFDLKSAAWVTPGRLEREGWVMLCPVREAWCVTEAQRQATTRPGATLRTFEVTNRYLGRPSKPGKFLVLMVPPRAG